MPSRPMSPSLLAPTSALLLTPRLRLAISLPLPATQPSPLPSLLLSQPPNVCMNASLILTPLRLLLHLPTVPGFLPRRILPLPLRLPMALGCLRRLTLLLLPGRLMCHPLLLVLLAVAMSLPTSLSLLLLQGLILSRLAPLSPTRPASFLVLPVSSPRICSNLCMHRTLSLRWSMALI